MSGAAQGVADPAGPVAPERRRRIALPAALRLDRFEALTLLAFTVMTLIPLLALATRPREITWTDGGLVADQLQYLGWIRSASEHLVIQNVWDVGEPGTSYFLHPGFLLSGLLVKAGLEPGPAYQLLWKPVALAFVFFGFLAYMRRMLPAGTRRHAGLVIALFYVSPLAAIVGLANIDPNRLKGQVEFMSGEMFPGLWMWGYMMTAIAVALVPLALLAAERARIPARRAPGRGVAWYVAWGAAAAFFMSWLQPWQGVVLLMTLGGVEAWRWRREGRPSFGRLARSLGPIAVAGVIPLAYYYWLSKADPSWELAGHVNSTRVGNWPWYAWAIGLLPIAIPVWWGYRTPARDWQDRAMRLLPAAMLLEYWIIYLTQAGTFPFHSVQGASIPIAILAVQGVAARRTSLPSWMTRRSVLWAGVVLVTLPGVINKLNIIREEVHKGGEPFFVERGERQALDYMERSPVRGGVMAPIYSGLLIPAYTGRHTWLGQISWTRDYDRRVTDAYALLTGGMGRAQAIRLVRGARGVIFVFGDCVGNRVDLEPLLRGYLSDVRRFGCASVYQLDRARLDRATPAA